MRPRCRTGFLTLFQPGRHVPEIPALRYRPAGRSLQLRYGPLAESDQFKRKHQPTASLARHGGFPLQKCAADRAHQEGQMGRLIRKPPYWQKVWKSAVDL